MVDTGFHIWMFHCIHVYILCINLIQVCVFGLVRIHIYTLKKVNRLPHVTTCSQLQLRYGNPDSKVHVTHAGPTWVLSAPGGPYVGPMNLAITEHIEKTAKTDDMNERVCHISIYHSMKNYQRKWTVVHCAGSPESQMPWSTWILNYNYDIVVNTTHIVSTFM